MLYNHLSYVPGVGFLVTSFNLFISTFKLNAVVTNWKYNSMSKHQLLERKYSHVISSSVIHTWFGFLSNIFQFVQNIAKPSCKNICMLMEKKLQILFHLSLILSVGHKYHDVIREFIVNVSSKFFLKCQNKNLKFKYVLKRNKS